MKSFITLIALLTVPVAAQEPAKPRVFITDSQSWEMVGQGGGSSDGGGGRIAGGARGQTNELIKTFNERCSDCIVTNKQDRADYIVTFDHEGGKKYFQKDNKFAIFNKEGDVIKSGSTRSLGNSVKDACTALMAEWKSYKSTTNNQEKTTDEKKQ